MNQVEGGNVNLWLIVMPSVMTLITVLISLFVGHYLGVRKHSQISDREKKQQLYGKLMGLAYESYHLYRSQLETSVYVYFYEGILPAYNPELQDKSLSEADKASLNDEKLSMKTYAEDNRHLAFEVFQKERENGREFYETLGSVITLFPKEHELREMVERIFKYSRLTVKQPEISDDDKKNRIVVLTKWKEKQLKACSNDAAKYWALIEALLLKIKS